MTDRLRTEQSIGIKQFLKSNNGLYQLVLQADGNLVLYGRQGRVPGGALWASGTDGKGGTSAVLQSDGNFVLYGPSGRVPGGALWASGTNGKGGTLLVMQDDGNLVIYKDDGTAVWATGTDEPQPDGGSVFQKEAYCCGMYSRRDGSLIRKETVYELDESRAKLECIDIADFYQATGEIIKKGMC